MSKIYREGAIGALMDEYERASIELAAIIGRLSQSEFEKILDPHTEDEDCRSVQTIINHVIRSGYGYANSIRRSTNQTEIKPVFQTNNPEEALIHFDKMLKYTEETLEGKWKMSYDEMFNTEVITSDGTKSNLEARLEHAIVHILRHRRQLEKLLKLKT
ncbi:MAG TPA: DinB family protein [Ignavibacteriaceae bacterium]|nr:DinB family protein [Ignavibacteriaceae bacterium]